MKKSSLVSALAFSSLFALAAHAEQYQGVLQFQSTESRAQVQAEAVAAAHGPDPYSEGASSGVAPAPTSSLARAQVRREAVAAAHAGNLYGDQLDAGVTPPTDGQVDRQAVRAQARTTAAHGVTEGTL